MSFVLNFIKNFILKWFTSQVLEKIVIIGLGELVKRTDSDVDDKMYNAVFNQTKVQDEKK